MASLIYSLGLLFMLGTSAIYHRINWPPNVRANLKKLDHAAIFILIASTSTPVAFFGLTPGEGQEFLLIIWVAAFFGILQSIFWISAPKLLTAIFYIVMGCLAVPYCRPMYEAMGLSNVIFILVGGAFYISGALFYAFKKPNLKPGVFGYHELFHLFTVLGIFFHFVVIYQLIN